MTGSFGQHSTEVYGTGSEGHQLTEMYTQYHNYHTGSLGQQSTNAYGTGSLGEQSTEFDGTGSLGQQSTDNYGNLVWLVPSGFQNVSAGEQLQMTCKVSYTTTERPHMQRVTLDAENHCLEIGTTTPTTSTHTMDTSTNKLSTHIQE